MGCCCGAPEEVSSSSSSSSFSQNSTEAVPIGNSTALAIAADTASASDPAASTFTTNPLPKAPPEPLAYVWGDNMYGQMGDGSQSNTTGVERPRNIQMFKQKRQPIDVSVGVGHVCLITKEGHLFGWGKNNKGQCGNQAKSQSGLTRPVRSSFFWKAPARKIAAVACGGDFSLVLTTDGKVFGFGGNALGQLGIGRKSVEVLVPEALPVSYIKNIAAGKAHGAVINSVQKLFLFGSNASRQLGLKADAPSPTEWMNGKAQSVACGDKCTAIVTPENSCLIAGAVCSSVTANSIFSTHQRLKGKKICQVAVGAEHVLFLTKPGKVFVWGAGWSVGCESESPKNPAGTKTCLQEPVEMQGLDSSGGKVVQVAAGQYHSLALLDDGLCYAWGQHGRSQLGIGMQMNTGIKKPVLVRDDSNGTLPFFYKVIAGGVSTIALADNAKKQTDAKKASLKLDKFDDVTAAAVIADVQLEDESHVVADRLRDLTKKDELAGEGNVTATKVDGDEAMTVDLAIAANLTRQAQATGAADTRETNTMLDDDGDGDEPPLPDDDDDDGPPMPED